VHQVFQRAAAAAAQGLGSVWVGAFDEQEASRILGLPSDQRPVTLLPIGYPGEVPARRNRRTLEDLVHLV